MKRSGANTGEKNKSAVALGKLRAAQMTTAERSAAGKARAKSLTKAERKAIASKAAKARWGEKKAVTPASPDAQ